MKIYHNPRCSKSRQTLQLINDAGKDVEIIEYLKDVPTEEELKSIIDLLGISPEQLLRKNEAIFKEQFKGRSFSDEEWIKIMIGNPKLIERPIVVDGKKAVLGRPPENVLSLL
ncbi:MAG: arsenate reductase (glutaredoxin) [Cyclobacteriaceae bacterium]|nr:arsenate reductase (glutaredoxin) [Cyclobacteriaceae bacterium]MCK5369730.1 arsenate reductase (glutaredoxin) [Cyclobacteriaceae bacterium]